MPDQFSDAAIFITKLQLAIAVFTNYRCNEATIYNLTTLSVKIHAN